MNAGKLNRRITYIKAGTAVSDGFGGTTVTPGASVETWCNAKPMSMDELIRYGMPEGKRAYMFTFRYHQGKNILQGSDLTFNSRSFKVNSVIDENEEYDKFIVIASEQV